MSKKPLVSIIIPVFNVEKYVSQCVKSIQNQTYINLEIILINDGSTDCSEDICKEYAQDDKRIVLLNQKNGGQSKARNKGLDFCHGEYILFVDADDYISKFLVEDTISFAIRENLDIVEYGHKNVNTNTKAEFVGEGVVTMKN
nr:glycosyltransferase [Limosilactobacillus reuteri]